MDAGNMRKSFGGDRTFGSGGMLADRQTDRHAHYNTTIIIMMAMFTGQMKASKIVSVAVFLATVVRGCSAAVSCYMCRSKNVPDCDDPFRNSSDVHSIKCPGDACIKAKGRAKGN